MRYVLLVTVLVAALCLPVGSAMADDGSVYGAFVSQNTALSKLGKQISSGIASWKHSDFKRPARALKALRGTVSTLDKVKAAVKRETPTSDHGRLGKAAALETVGLLRGGYAALGQSVTAVTHGHGKTGLRLVRKSRKMLNKAIAAGDRTRSEFQAAGVLAP